MKLFITLGTNTDPYEHVVEFNSDVYVEYLGLEIESQDKDIDAGREIVTGRQTILRISFTPGGISINRIEELEVQIATLIEGLKDILRTAEMESE